MVSFLLFFIFVPDDKMVEMQPLQWKEYEEVAYPTKIKQIIFPLEKIDKPFKKTNPLPDNYHIS